VEVGFLPYYGSKKQYTEKVMAKFQEEVPESTDGEGVTVRGRNAIARLDYMYRKQQQPIMHLLNNETDGNKMSKALISLLEDQGYELVQRKPKAKFEFNSEDRSALWGLNYSGPDCSIDGQPALLLDIGFKKHDEELALLQEEAERNGEKPPELTKFTKTLILLKAAGALRFSEHKVRTKVMHFSTKTHKGNSPIPLSMMLDDACTRKQPWLPFPAILLMKMKSTTAALRRKQTANPVGIPSTRFPRARAIRLLVAVCSCTWTTHSRSWTRCFKRTSLQYRMTVL
jgi:hypothetical protein